MARLTHSKGGNRVITERREIPVELSEDQIDKMPDSEKLKWLVALNFANYAELRKQGKLLYGNGDIGLCEKVRGQGARLNWLWFAFTGVNGVIITTLIYCLTTMGK